MLRLESSWHGRSVDHDLTYSGRQIAVGSQKPSRIMRQKTCCASESNTSVRVVFANRSGFDAPIGVILAWEERGSCLNIFWTTNHYRISETFTNHEAKDSLRKSVDHALKYSGRQIAVGSQKPSQITRQKTCFASESNTSVCVVLANQSDSHAPIGVVLAWEKRGSCINIFRTTNHGRISETFTNYEAKDLLRKSVDHVLTYSGRQIAVGSQKPSRITRQKTCCAIGSQKPSRITRQKTCCASESNTSVRVAFANRNGFDAPIGVVLAWEELSQTRRFAYRSGFDAPIGVVLAWEERGSCLNIFRTKNRGRISETFTYYEAKDLLRKSVDHVLTYSGRQIAVGSQKPSRITRQKTCCASGSSTSVGVVFANRSGFDAPIGVVLAWEECGSCLNIFRTTNRDRISETFMNYEAKDLFAQVSQTRLFANRSGFDAPIGVVLAWEELSKTRRFANRSGFDAPIGVVSAWEERGSVSQTRRFANRSGFDAPIGVVLAWEERGSCLNIFRTRNYGQISETLTNYEAKDLRRKQKTCCANESNTSAGVVFANRSGFDAPIGVVLAWEERGPCLNIFRTTNRGRISETFTNFEAKDLLRKSVDHVFTYSGRQSRSDLRNLHELRGKRLVAQHILDDKSRSDLRNLHELRGKRLVAQMSQTRRLVNRSGFDAPIGVVLAWEERGSCVNIFRTKNRGLISETFTNYEAKYLLRNESSTSVRVVFANRSGFDAPIGVVLAWEERGSCLNIFRTTNRGGISETFANYEAKDLLRKSVDHVLTYSGRQIAVGSQKPSRITRQKTCCTSESNRSIRVVFANQSGFDAPIGVVLAWEERGSCLNIFRTTNRGRISETFTNYEAKDLLRKSVDHALTYSGRQIAVGSQKPSRITRQKTCCASESITSVRNRSGFDAPIGVVLAWEECGSCLNIFRTSNRSGISETFTNYEAKTCCANESNTSVGVVFANRSGFDAPIGVVLAWEERGSCLNIFRTTNRGRISETFTNYEAKDLFASETNTLVRVVFANRSGFDAPIGVVLAWEERGSCLIVFWTTNHDRISETFTNYEAKDLLRK
ncbi:uncharacterized protein G2W53_009797 [Senna tora]|uniref:Uncharacterized protein n=1 Tax=Senna tora TaxID=362788 RepID=A0A834WYT0_9FABA|nr:uncharacterized protein G2W53_009797 [Senna tora]